MKPRTTLIACVLLASLSMPIAGQECTDWVPRFELVLHEPARGEFYEGEPIVVEIWVVDVCPTVVPQVDSSFFYMLRDCVSWAPDCTSYFHVGACCLFIDGRKSGSCGAGIGCNGDLNETGVQTVGAEVEQCGKTIPVSPDGRAFLGTANMSYAGALEATIIESFTVGDGEFGRCKEQKAVIEWRGPPQDPVVLHPEDAEPVFIRVRRRPFLRGDSNLDGILDLSDPIHILTVLFLGQNQFECANASDADDNNRHEITDAIAILVFLFSGGAPPAPPYPEPGYDQTPTSPEMSIHSGCSTGVFP